MSDRTIAIESNDERDRRALHAKLFILYQNDIQRAPGGGDLWGTTGRLIMDMIRSVKSGGREDEAGRKEVHMLLANMFDPSRHVQREAVRETALIKLAPCEVLAPELTESPTWQIARESSGFDGVGMTALEWSLAMGCSAVRPSLVPSFAPGLCAVPPHRYIVFASPTNPLDPIAYLEFLAGEYGPVMFISVQDPDYPRYEIWRTLADLKRASGKRGTGAPIDSRNGDLYRWRYGVNRRPLLPVAFLIGDPTSTTLTPANAPLLMGTIDMMIEHTDNKRLAYVTAAPKAAISSKSGVTGLERASLDFFTALVMEGEDIKVEVIPSGTSGAKDMMEITNARMDGWLGQAQKGLRLRQDKGAQSGRAIELEMVGLWQWWSAQSASNLSVDRHMVRILISSWNWAIRVGWWKGDPLPEPETIGIEHVPMWTPDQRRQILGDIWNAIEIGAATEVDYYLAMHGHSQAHRAEAESAIIELKREKARIQQASDFYEVRLSRNEMDATGQGGIRGAIQFIQLERDKAIAGVLKGFRDADVPLDVRQYCAPYGLPMLPEGAVENGPTFTPPPEVQTEASAALNLRPRRGDMLSERKARSLGGGVAQTLLEMRKMASWFESHEDDATTPNIDADGNPLPGEWGNDTNPSARYTNWRLRGGDPCRAWVNAELDKLDGVPGENEEEGMVEEGQPVDGAGSVV